MADDIKKIIEESGEQTRKEIGGLRQDIKDVGILVEAVQSDVTHIAEAVDTHTKQIKEIDQRLQKVEKDVTEVKDDVAVIKVAVGMAEGEKPLKQRVEELEAKAT